MRVVRVFYAAVLISVPICGQQHIVDPPELEYREGVSAYRYAAGNRNAKQSMRVWQFMQIHDNIAAKGPVAIKGMAFRRDGGTSFHWNAWRFEMELKLSTSPLTSRTYSNVFANNMGKDVKTVISKKWVNMPFIPRTLAFPEPFLFRLVFDPGKSFTLAKGKSLAWHWIGYDNDLMTADATHHYLDRDYISDYSPGKTLPGGCFSAGWAYFRPQYSTTRCWFDNGAKRWAFYGYTDHGPFLGTAFHVMGLPMSPPGSFLNIGGPDFFGQPCRLFIDLKTLMLSAPYKLDTKGYASTPKEKPFWVLPYNPLFCGINFWTQSLTIDSSNRVYLSNVTIIQPHYIWPGSGMGISYVEIAEHNRHLNASSPYHRKDGCLPVQFML